MTALYIHIPFCAAKCPYCGFTSFTGQSEETQQQYIKALITDITSCGVTRFDTLYIGGGTPSVPAPALMDNLLDRLLSIITVKGEFTVEANPESLSADFLKTLRSHGVNRLSMGCQSTEPDVLKLLGRIHSREEIFSGYDLARKELPEADINLDLIFDIPGVPHDSSMKSLEEITALGPEHISAYSYSQDTDHLAGVVSHEDSLFMTVKHFLENKGWRKYEISNFARAGHESRHNITYWLLGDFIGAGLSAWSLFNTPEGRQHKGKTDELHKYLENPSDYGETSFTLKDELLKETIVFGLRMLDGVVISPFEKPDDGLSEKLIELEKEGMISWTKNNIKVTEKGELLLDSVLEYLW
jgi:oxygen-independent coproporphyrinogen-3 oxidase